MSSENKQLDLFDRYLFGQLNTEQKAEFENYLATDELFARSFDVYKKMIRGIQHAEENKMRVQIREIMNKEKSYLNSHKTLKKMKKYFSFRFAAAAAVLLLLSTGIYFYLNKGNLEQDYMAQVNKMEIRDVNSYMDQLRAPGIAKMDEGRLDSLQVAIELYQLGHFKEARAKFDTYLRIYTNDAMAIYHLGEIEMGEQNYNKAIEKFQLVINDTTFELKDYALLHLGQCLALFDGNQSKKLAVKYFKMVLNHPNPRLHAIAGALISMYQ